MPIPRLIHQMWIDPGDDPAAPLPANMRPGVDAWIAAHPGYTHRLWSLPEVLDACETAGRTDVAAAIRLCRFPSMQADLARLFLLDTRGGFWSDIKVLPRQPIPEALLGFETVVVEHFPRPNRPEPDGLLINSFIGAAARAPLIATTLALALANIRERQGDGVFAITGGAVLTMAWRALLLASPGLAPTIAVVPHTAAWGGMLGQTSETYDTDERHWSARQHTEALYLEPEPDAAAPNPTGLFQAIPGHVTRIDRFHSRQGFYPFEPRPAFCWASDQATPRLFFDAALPFDRMRLKLFAVPGYDPAMVRFRLNGAAVAAFTRPEQPGWHIVDLGPFVARPAWNQLTIEAPAPAAVPDSADGRRLSVALAWVQPRIGV